MKLYKKLGMLLAMLFLASISYADVPVKGYYKKDGTYVQPHMRHSPGDTKEEKKPEKNVEKQKVVKEKVVKEKIVKEKEPKKTTEAVEKTKAGKEGDVSVKGYYRKDGTYVQPYHRSSPTATEDKSAKTVEPSNHMDKKADKKTDNKVDKKADTKLDKKEGDVSVKGYYRKDGTYVKPYHRSSPNKTDADNWSTKGNVNPYTGKEGTKEPKK